MSRAQDPRGPLEVTTPQGELDPAPGSRPEGSCCPVERHAAIRGDALPGGESAAVQREKDFRRKNTGGDVPARSQRNFPEPLPGERERVRVNVVLSRDRPHEQSGQRDWGKGAEHTESLRAIAHLHPFPGLGLHLLVGAYFLSDSLTSPGPGRHRSKQEPTAPSWDKGFQGDMARKADRGEGLPPSGTRSMNSTLFFLRSGMRLEVS